MKKDVAASAAGAVAPKKPEFSLIDEDLLKSRIYTIRGVKVMLDADLAEIYVYASGCWPSCAFHAHSVTCISVNRAVKLEFSGLHAYMPNRIFPAPSSIWQIRI